MVRHRAGMTPLSPRVPVNRRLLAALGTLAALTILLMIARAALLGRGRGFLVWNLMLAAVPLGAAWLVRAQAHAARSRRLWRGAWIATGGLVWLAFWPNAPYIVTDLMHLRTSEPAWVWLDTLLIGATATTGLFAGLVSLRWVHEAALALGVRARGAWLGVLAACVLGGFGVYVGRFLRWNSWDLLTRPGELLDQAFDVVGFGTALFTGLFAIGLAVAYVALALLVGRPARDEVSERG